ncbi:MAG: hypothetical protein M3P04_08090 [Actinomycetota bacterium]|nr:hypothetical protein [Actinomycetota bacterium]
MKRLLVILPLVLLAPACSGSDKDRVSSGLSKADYLTKAEAICTRINTDLHALTFPSTPEAVKAFALDTLHIAEVGTKDIKQLEPPAADQAEIKVKLLDPLDGKIAEGKVYVDKIKAAVDSNDQQTLGALIANPPTGSKADLAWMRSYGFKACVKAADTGR